jgi:uncharacterized protein YjbI with pentapeptide repeats
LSGIDLHGLDLSSNNHPGIDLSGANLCYANLSGTDLRHANLRDAFLYHADLSDARLYHANLNYTNLDGAIFYHANLCRARLLDAGISRRSYFDDSDLRGTNIFSSVWPFSYDQLSNAKIDLFMAAQLAYFFCDQDCDDKRYLKARNAILKFANLFAVLYHEFFDKNEEAYGFSELEYGK